MISLTAISKKHSKRIDNWMRLKSTKALIRQYPDSVKTTKGGTNKGETVGTIEVAQEFERWCQKCPKENPRRIYLVWAVGSDMFKIGIAKHPFTRVKSMQTGSPLKLIVSRTYRCDNPKPLEDKLHEVFKPYFSHGEWFEIESDKACKLFDTTVSRWTIPSISI